MNIVIIGLGLIGGSLALTAREKGFAQKILGFDANEKNLSTAMQLRIADETGPWQDLIQFADLIILAIPVDATEKLLPEILDRIDHQVIMDVGSTKQGILEVIKDHKKRGRFVATHPMWGTEYSGPEAATNLAFTDKACVICNKEESDTDALEMVESLYRSIGMHLIYMNAKDHDLHVAYISHISHITSFALANTVLEKEREDDAIFELASGGFESTVRLAKSNADMWVPIFMQNRENILDVLNEHISQLRKFKSCLEKENFSYLSELIVQANKIKRILK